MQYPPETRMLGLALTLLLLVVALCLIGAAVAEAWR